MSKIYVMCGLIGSGKSTEARRLVMENKNIVAINRDHMRIMFNAGTYDFNPNTEPLNLELQNLAMLMCLDKGFNVVLDACFLKVENRAKVFEVMPIHAQIVCVYCTESVNNLANRMTDPRGYTEEYWSGVLESMREAFEPPTLDEPFEDIIIHAI